MDAPVRLSVRIDRFAYPDGTLAMSNVHLDVLRGEFIGILGSNGSGKTTLLRLMDGLIRNFQGAVRLDGTEIGKLSPRQIYAKVGLVFQNPDEQLFAPTVLEDVSFGPQNMGYRDSEIRERSLAALQQVDMEVFSRKSIHHLSFGQKKRVCIAGLLAMGHEILLLDEPTAGLDPMGEYRMMQLLMKLNRESGVTVVMATHSVDLVPLFLSRLLILSKGTIARSGTPEEVFTAPEAMGNVKLRLPQMAELIYRLKHEDGVGFGRVPLTIGEARREILWTLEERRA